MTIVILTESELRQSVELDQEAIVAVADAFIRLVEGNVTVPPILRVDIPENNGEVDIKTAYIQGLDSFAIKVASGFFGNPRLGLPTGSGLMILISAKTGFPEALLLDNGYLTNVRTGAAGAIAARHLARKDTKIAGVIGSGTQARYQMRALKLVRDFQRLLVYSIDPDKTSYIEEMKQVLNLEVVSLDNPEEVVRTSDVVVTATPSHEPYLKPEWLSPGLHITCMGSDAETKQELYADVFAHANVVACDRKSQCFRLGELHHALDEGILSQEDDIIELGEFVAGKRPGRQREEEITICDLTGVGVQDTAIALLAYRKAMEKGLGMPIDA
jgi:ectoine utilization protein EutC